MRKLATGPLACFWLLLAAMLGLAVAGGVRYYLPVPAWDMWTGALDFAIRAESEGLAPWWERHNEHRIVLPRLLYWAEYHLFHSSSKALIALNYLFVALVALFFNAALRLRLSEGTGARNPAGDGDSLSIGLFIAAWLFLWIQRENLIWAFQSAFFLAFLLPLGAFAFFEASLSGKRSGRWFAACLVGGVLSVGTMANGLLALPVMLVFAIALRQSLPRVALLALAALLCTVAYFHGFEPLEANRSPAAALLQAPGEALGFILLYLGNPFFHLVGGGAAGRALGIAMGAFLALLWLHAIYRLLKGRLGGTAAVTLLCFIAYVGASATATAAGRASFSYAYAVGSRYATPGLMAWAAVAVLSAPLLKALLCGRWRPAVLGLAALLSLAMLLAQSRALWDGPSTYRTETDAGALALELGARDPLFESILSPTPEVLPPIAEGARERGLSVFGQFPWSGLRERLGVSAPPLDGLPSCQGAVTAAAALEESPRFLRVSGWLLDAGGGSAPRLVSFITLDGRVAGFALTSQRARSQQTWAALGREQPSGEFIGYLLADAADKLELVRGDEALCDLPLSDEDRARMGP